VRGSPGRFQPSAATAEDVGSALRTITTASPKRSGNRFPQKTRSRKSFQPLGIARLSRVDDLLARRPIGNDLGEEFLLGDSDGKVHCLRMNK
jgi:hypothetical protein